MRWITGLTMAAGVVLVMGVVSQAVHGQDKQATNPLRVGVYDSRCIAIACFSSEWWNTQVREKMKEMEAAKAAGDQTKIKELEQWGSQNQQKAHLMGFGTAPVKEWLTPVQDELATVAQQAGVDIIVSKWKIDYQVDGAQFMDVTDVIVALYKPSEKALKSIEAIKKTKPISEEVILKIKD
ncbi:MAG: hypothetical protein JXB18_15160 [Sedimentisphaerales bacterium]|nr:hypothetical protein [Sedimentisphaerales bacterium]